MRWQSAYYRHCDIRAEDKEPNEFPGLNAENPRPLPNHRYRYDQPSVRRHDQPDIVEDLIDSMD